MRALSILKDIIQDHKEAGMDTINLEREYQIKMKDYILYGLNKPQMPIITTIIGHCKDCGANETKKNKCAYCGNDKY
jgi:hypothetical protein